MKLILESIKALFRGVNESVRTLAKRIDTAQAEAKSAKDTAVKAQKTANAANVAAAQASVPICQAVSTDGKTYEVDIGREVKSGELVVIIPNMSSQSTSVKLKINGMTYSVYRNSNRGTSARDPLPQDSFLWEGKPVLMMLLPGEYSGDALLVGFNTEEASHFAGTCQSSASATVKEVPGTAGLNTLTSGRVIVYVRFLYGNTASNPKLTVSGFTVPIVDRFGSPISVDAIKSGVLYQFVYFNSRWVLMD